MIQAANKRQILFVINQPEVYKSPSSNTYMFVTTLRIHTELNSNYIQCFR